MPLVNATPKGRLDGSTVTQFTNTTNINATTYTYPTTQTNLIIENSGEHDIYLTVGSVTDQLIKVDTKYQYDGQFTQFAIRSDIDSQEFIATAIYQEYTDFNSLNDQLNNVTTQLAQNTSLTGANTSSLQTTYTNGNLTQSKEFDVNNTLLIQQDITYNSDGTINTITETINGKQYLTTLNYVNGSLDTVNPMTRSVI